MDSQSKALYKAKLIKLLKFYITVCEVNGLRYFCCGGTAIGAVRHHGMIPWDDDIDVFMPRIDYDKFVEIIKQKYSDDVDILTPEIANYYLPFTKLCDKNSTILEFVDLPCVFGVFLDVFPLDGASDSILQQKIDLKSYQKTANRLKAIAKKPIDNFKSIFKRLLSFQLITAYNEFVYMFFKDYQRMTVLRDLDLISRANSFEKSDYICNYAGMWGMKEFAKKEWFISSVDFDFEGVVVKLPVGYNSYLTNIYGNYMEPPPMDKQVSHHNVAFIDLYKRWTLEEVLNIIKSK